MVNDLSKTNTTDYGNLEKNLIRAPIESQITSTEQCLQYNYTHVLFVFTVNYIRIRNATH